MADQIPRRTIFYDPHQRRWWRWRQGFFLAAVLLSALMVGFVLNALSPPRLAVLDLPYQTRAYRPVPEISKPKVSREERRKRRLAAMIARAGNVNKAPAAGPPPGDSAAGAPAPLMVAFFDNEDTTSLTSFFQHWDKIDFLVPTWLQLGDGGTLNISDDSENAKAAREFIKRGQIDIKIMPLLSNFNGQTWRTDQLAQVLASADGRARLISNLLAYIKPKGYAGVNIDFEDVPEASQEGLRTFMSELYQSFHSQNLMVSQDLPSSDSSFDYSFYAGVNDFVVLMDYDQHWAASEPGAIAGQDWFVSTVQKQAQKIPKNKLVVALGNYGYDWIEVGRHRYRGKSVSFQDAMRTASESQVDPETDPDSLNPTYDYYDEENRIHHLWFLDGVTVYNQVAQAKQFSPRGFALWRLGSEDPTAWAVLADFKTTPQSAERLKPLTYGYDVDFNGEGELMRIKERPKPGERDFTLDPKLNLITDEAFTTLPLGYLLDREGRQKNKMAITFDDGPDPRFTPRILDILKQYHAPATFFLVGLEAQNNIGLARRIVSEGHEIGNHTFFHPNIADTSPREMEIEINLTQRLFESKLGRQSLFFRPPYGVDTEPDTPSSVRPLELVQDMGYLMVGERPDSMDWYYTGEPQKILETTLSQLSRGNVLLLHDAGGDRSATVEALPQIITALRKRGFEIVSLSSLIGRTRDQVMPPTPAAGIWRARVDSLAFSSFSVLGHMFQVLFIIGIVFGIGRFVFIGTLAIIQEVLRHREHFNDSFTPFVTVIVPALNEEKVIVRTITALLRSDYPHFEIIVVDDGSADSTAARVRSAFGEDPRVRLFVVENRGKAEALNFGLSQSSAEIIIALDADTQFERDTIRKLVRHFEVKEVGAVAGNTKVGNRMNLITRWQALEYITSQNLDRRAFDALNCITVVPGAVGAWRRDLILEAGCFTSETLAEDTDLTIAIRRLGYEIVYEDKAIAYTEAPDRLRTFLKQRFRWAFGTLQSVWKHRDTFFRRRYGSLGFVALPNIVIFQLLFPLISPLMDLLVVASFVLYELQRHFHGTSYSTSNLLLIGEYYLIFLGIDYLTGALAFVLERKEDWTLLFWLFWQRLLYRQLMYYIAIKSLLAALRGKVVAWARIERKATVPLSQ